MAAVSREDVGTPAECANLAWGSTRYLHQGIGTDSPVMTQCGSPHCDEDENLPNTFNTSMQAPPLQVYQVDSN